MYKAATEDVGILSVISVIHLISQKQKEETKRSYTSWECFTGKKKLYFSTKTPFNPEKYTFFARIIPPHLHQWRVDVACVCTAPAALQQTETFIKKIKIL